MNQKNENMEIIYTLFINKKKIGVGKLGIDNKQAHFTVENKIVRMLNSPEVTYIGCHGIRIKGYEQNGYTRKGEEKYLYKEWFCRYTQTKEMI